jgi:hypothetical protein
MNCEEFEEIGLESRSGLTIVSLADAGLRAEARDHAADCPRCAALQESWLAAQEELSLLRATTEEAQAPARVEMRLRYEFRALHRAQRARVAGRTAVWFLATAAVLVGAASLRSWYMERHQVGQARSISDTELIADNEGFTPLPGSYLQDTDDAAIVRVRLQRGALGALGLPVNAERASEWVQVDLLVGDDGQPQGVRVPVQEQE